MMVAWPNISWTICGLTFFERSRVANRGVAIQSLGPTSCYKFTVRTERNNFLLWLARKSNQLNLAKVSSASAGIDTNPGGMRFVVRLPIRPG